MSYLSHMVFQYMPPATGVTDWTFNRKIQAPTSVYFNYLGVDVDQGFSVLTVVNLSNNAELHACIENDDDDSIIVAPTTIQGIYHIPAGTYKTFDYGFRIERLRIHATGNSKIVIEAEERRVSS